MRPNSAASSNCGNTLPNPLNIPIISYIRVIDYITMYIYNIIIIIIIHILPIIISNNCTGAFQNLGSLPKIYLIQNI
jgi:hypothetical protein